MKYYYDHEYGVHYWKNLDGGYCARYCTKSSCIHEHTHKNAIIDDKMDIEQSLINDEKKSHVNVIASDKIIIEIIPERNNKRFLESDDTEPRKKVKYDN